MCVAAVAIRQSEEFPFVLVHNRDEFFRRPSRTLELHGKIAGGTDEQAGGMWLGVRKGAPPHFAFVTNLRLGPPFRQPAKRSRGELVRNYLEGEGDSAEFIEKLAVPDYGPFNLVLGAFDGFQAFYSSECVTLSFSEGVHAFSNGDPRVRWPKAKSLGEAVGGILRGAQDDEQLIKIFMQVLSDDQKAKDEELPNTGVSLEWERALSPIWVQTKDYGTVASTVILQNKTGVIRIWERTRNGKGRFEITQLNL